MPGFFIMIFLISIHAPRVGSDSAHSSYPALGRISIHAPRVGSDMSPVSSRSTSVNFYPRSPRGERQFGVDRVWEYSEISIHAPRVGSDRERHKISDLM